MEKIRKSYFSGSWYPGSDMSVRDQIKKWEKELNPAPRNLVCGIVPHAGWFFSGILAYDVIRRIREDTETVIILGGHLPAGFPILYYNEDYIETPCGKLEIDKNIISRILEEIDLKIDKSPDNTIEVQLPLIKALYENVKIVPLRIPSGMESLDIINNLFHIGNEMGRKTVIIGSTDLTHYGTSYNFAPDDSLADPQGWVRKSDRKIIDSMLNMEVENILKIAEDNKSACSPGAAAGAVLYASLKGINKGTLLSYDTSLSRHQADSFVGYSSIVYTD